MAQLLITEGPQAQHARRHDSPAPQARPEPASPAVAQTTGQTTGRDAMHGMVPCDRECPYCWGPETD